MENSEEVNEVDHSLENQISNIITEKIIVVKKEVEIIFVICKGLDKFNIEFEETNFYIKLLEDTTFENINFRILSRLGLDCDEELVYRSKDKTILDLSKTVSELKLKDKDIVYVEEANAVPRNRKKVKTVRELAKEEPIELICSTRVGSEDGSLRKIKVFVNPKHYCHDLLEEVSLFYGRSGLKFKCGRVVLKAG